eukprot:10603857-Prorocentrum_lima.AAC.1
MGSSRNRAGRLTRATAKGRDRHTSLRQHRRDGNWNDDPAWRTASSKKLGKLRAKWHDLAIA